MNVLFEEDGGFKAGTVFADNVSSLQVEMASGKRVKIKAASVLLRFAEPGPTALLERGEQESQDLEVDFLWEMCGDEEFGFADFAREYFGHAPSSVEASAVLLRLFSAPMYFHRKGKGRFRKAPEDILKAALAGQERKRLQAEAQARMAGDLAAGRLPAEFPPLLKQILYKPDRNTLEVKALEAACGETGLSAAHLLEKCGAIPSSHEFHFNRFLFEYFPQGTDFGSFDFPAMPEDLPRAGVAAFSVDDATTTEIDDAFSVTPLPGGGWHIGIHIAAPGLGVTPDSALDRIARSRLSTVYMPGRKITMLPDEAVERFTLSAGRDCPALSLYLTVTPDLVITARDSRVEQVPVVANLRHHDIEPVFNETTLAEGGPDFPYKEELTLLWRLAEVLEAGRGKPSANQNFLDFNYYVDWSEPEGRISIGQRQRGSPLDKLVAELMIVANSSWGRLLADAKVAAIYRAQAAGKVRMTTAALPHEGLGVDCYAWSSSPLRRYVDLMNQWQLLAHLKGETPPFGARSEGLHSALRDFELTYAAYNEFQRGMERYWCLRWLRQEGVKRPAAKVVRENLVRLEDIPFFLKVPSLPACHPGTRVLLEVEHMDFLEVEARCRFVEVLAADAQADLDQDIQEE
ncbi:MAG: RNB domain-containing ribonuclease [Rhodocyclaceae bacterium]|nr:RNB domain-containing ribonuclease [Rhodocyclaceae bacterium]